MSYATQIASNEEWEMRGETIGQHEAFSYVSLEDRIPADHPLRTIRIRADAALKRLSPPEHQVAARFFAEVVRQARAVQLLSEEHFTADGTLIESLASLKSVRRRCHPSRSEHPPRAESAACTPP